jgi:hypothetical protein
MARVIHVDLAAAKPPTPELEAAFRYFDLCPELAESPEIDIDRTTTELAATGRNRARPSESSQQWTGHEKGRSHAHDEFRGRLERPDSSGTNADAVTLGVEIDLGTERPQQLRHDHDILEERNVLEDTFLLGQERRSHRRQGRIFRAADRDTSSQDAPADRPDSLGGCRDSHGHLLQG